MSENINEVRERLGLAFAINGTGQAKRDVAALLADHTRLQKHGEEYREKIRDVYREQYARGERIEQLEAENARLQALENALGGWSLAANEDGTVGVVCLRADSPGGDVAIDNDGRLAQRLLHALVTDIVAARKEVQS